MPSRSARQGKKSKMDYTKMNGYMLINNGIELEGLIAAFPKFPAEDIVEIYQEIHKFDKSVDVRISINRS